MIPTILFVLLHVFKMDFRLFSQKTWMEVESLGDRALFSIKKLGWILCAALVCDFTLGRVFGKLQGRSTP